MTRETVLITGGARGQGRSHALGFAARGADVAVLDIGVPIDGLPYELATSDDLRETADLIAKTGARGLAVACDVRDSAQVQAAADTVLAEFGHIDTLVLNHGIWSTGRFWEVSEEAWTSTFDVNVNGSWRMAKAVAPSMIQRREGNIIIIGSTSATIPTQNYAHYAASKAALVQLTKIFAAELGEFGVRVNSVSPGLVDTPMVNFQAVYDRVRPGASREEFLAGGYAMTLLAGRRQLDPSSVTAAVLWLASAQAADITGLDLVIDAGNRLLPRHNPRPWTPEGNAS
ncbi:mycofactocin-coupled SDR family oxidoreductase [Acrocarpospora macrocephala]|uniref:3-ketoacyl-ACP reductase n=1 Tax=Acrocarpospora macrocephala TaxID=150177 RepID=A0A5M3WZV8_9ACTN|nr:SDR family oxidoreductase [Acrocarpospora macrocephala]GES13862.1 3-ketoacyl-ACP reductase [Acrocarpospora macrocephala]